jgi:uncharacterized protein (UPF0332 family)
LLDSARLIRACEPNESVSRAVISRAYYAAYHAAKEFHTELPSPGSVRDGRGRHEQLVKQLLNPALPVTDPRNLKSRQVGNLLQDLLRDRVTADYRLGSDVVDEEADDALFKAERLFTLIQ